MSGLLALCPLGVEARAVHAGAPSATVLRTGAGPQRAARRAADAARAAERASAVVVAGVGGGLDPDLRPGDLVVAGRVVDPGGATVAELGGAEVVAAALVRAGLPARVGTVAASPTLVRGGPSRRRLAAASGAVAVEMESAALLPGPWAAPTAVVRAVADAPGRELLGARTVTGGLAALRALARAAAVLELWAAAAGPRRVVLAGPRSFCAGVERAVATVERALERFGAPVYVRRQIVHNTHVVAGLEARGAVFVHELDAVPDGATVVLSAHGVAPAVHDEAAARPLRVVDATCPLVAKVHREIHRFADRGQRVVLVGHAGHDETEGSLGHADGIRLVSTAEDVEALDLGPDEPVAYVTQTTLSTDDTEPVLAAMRRRWPQLAGPAASDICYATSNRQDAVRAVAAEADVVLVAGSPTSSNAARLVEVAGRTGTPAHLVDGPAAVDLAWLAGARTVGLSAAASTPPAAVDALLGALAGLGPLDVTERTTRTESVTFPLPPEVR